MVGTHTLKANKKGVEKAPKALMTPTVKPRLTQRWLMVL